MKTNVYIDGFNFYYGMYRAPRNLPWKWLDIRALCERLDSNCVIHRIRYFTANPIVSPRDPQQGIRHEAFFRAVETLPDCTVHRGRHQVNPKDQSPQHPIPLPDLVPPLSADVVPEVRRAFDALKRITVMNIEEKGTDVSLASHLLVDVATGDCEAIMVISNDSDLATPLELARTRFGIDVTVYSPRNTVTTDLKNAATRYRVLRPGMLEGCLLPDVVVGKDGREIHKPEKWALAEERYRARGKTVSASP